MDAAGTDTSATGVTVITPQPLKDFPDIWLNVVSKEDKNSHDPLPLNVFFELRNHSVHLQPCFSKKGLNVAFTRVLGVDYLQ